MAVASASGARREGALVDAARDGGDEDNDGDGDDNSQAGACGEEEEEEDGGGGKERVELGGQLARVESHTRTKRQK